MRIKVDLSCSKLPLLYRHRFMALIKEALSRSNTIYKKSLYPDKITDHSKVVKPFCFSVSFPAGRKPMKEEITLDEDVKVYETVFYFPPNGHISMYVSSIDYEFIVFLYNGLLEVREFPFSEDIILKTKRVLMLNEKRIVNDEVTFKTRSPILIEDKDGTPILPFSASSESFNEHFNAIHDRILKDLRGEGLYKKLEFVPLKLKKQVVKHTLKGFREKTGKPYMTLTCFEGCFTLRGDPRDLQTLYQAGVGLRTGQGFGMVEVE